MDINKKAPKDGATRTRQWRERKKQAGMKPVQYMLTDEQKKQVNAFVEALLKSKHQLGK